MRFAAGGFGVLSLVACSNDPIVSASPGSATDAGTRNGPPGTGTPAAPGTSETPALLLELEDALHQTTLPSARVNIAKDPVYNWEPRTFLAWPLLEVAKKSPDFARVEEASKKEPYAIVFSALDRFKVTLPFEYLYNGKGYLAFKEADRADGHNWALIPAQEQAKTPAPFYVIWNVPEPSFDYPSPYQVAYFKMLPMRQAFADAYPNDPTLMDGFKYFTSRCVWCHAVNLSGGRSAKEFNVPENLTERMTKENFLKHLRGQGTYGERKPGCAMMWPSDAQADAAWNYLTGMKLQKLCNSEQTCEPYKNR